MSNDRELMQQALDFLVGGDFAYPTKLATDLRERLARQEFITHEEGEDGWSEWVCPNPKSYLMKCCDCGLVHEAQFGVVRYASETEREDCDMVDDPNLQAVFRMRRSEQWSPADTAHRAGWLPMGQPAQQEPFGYVTVRRLSQRFENHADQYHFYPAGQSPYLDNVDELHAVYIRPQACETVDLEAVYETIIRWDIGGGKRSRRELARRIVALYAAHIIGEKK